MQHNHTPKQMTTGVEKYEKPVISFLVKIHLKNYITDYNSFLSERVQAMSLRMFLTWHGNGGRIFASIDYIESFIDQFSNLFTGFKTNQDAILEGDLKARHYKKTGKLWTILLRI